MITQFILYRRCKTFVNLADVMYYKLDHGDNTSKILWKNDDVRSLDQLYLPLELIKMSKKLGIDDQELLYRLLLQEWGYMLYRRTEGLTLRVRKAAFIVAASVIEKRSSGEYQLAVHEKWLEECFKKRDFELWELRCAQYSLQKRI